MKDKFLDWLEDHNILNKVVIACVIIFIILLAIRIHNVGLLGNKKVADKEATSEVQATDATSDVSSENKGLQKDEEEVNTQSEYQASLGLNAEKGDGRVEVTATPTPTETATPEVQKTPKYEVVTNVFDHTNVPKVNVDGSSCKKYLSNVSLADFGTYWGNDLTKADFKGNKRYLVGVKQNPDDYEKGSLSSVGWLSNKLSAGALKSNDCVKFTNLHVIGSLSDTHVALLCSYDWYSAFGLKDTLVVFEDISNTLKKSDFKNGSIFSATVYVHNMKVKTVNNEKVVVCQYATFK